LRYGGPAARPPATADAYAGADWSAGYFDEFRRAVRVDWKPYVEWWHRPFRGSYVTLDERGLRRTPGETTADDQAIRILCFGGSTMMGMGARDEQTIPAVLARRLTALGHRVAVTNYGQLGHNSTQEVISLHQLLKAGTRADIALFYDGINEMISAEQTGAADRLFNDARRVAEFNLLHPSRRGDLVLAALAAAMPRSLRRLRQLTGLALRGPMPPPEADLAQLDVAGLARQVVDAYAATVRLARLLAGEHGLRTLFFWQPVITTKTVKSADEQRFEQDYTKDVAAGAALRRGDRRAPRGVPSSHGRTCSTCRHLRRRGGPDLHRRLSPVGSGNIAVAEAMLPARRRAPPLPGAHEPMTPSCRRCRRRSATAPRSSLCPPPASPRCRGARVCRAGSPLSGRGRHPRCSRRSIRDVRRRCHRAGQGVHEETPFPNYADGESPRASSLRPGRTCC
jgi:hypothetical protein